MYIPSINKTAKIKKIAVILSEKCNFNCWYCDIGNLKKPKTADLNVIRPIITKLDQSDSFEAFTLTGGEPGILPPEYIDAFFESIKCHPARVNTNGAFVRNGWWDKYKDQIDQMGIHHSIDVTDIPEELHFDMDEYQHIAYYVPTHIGNVDDALDLAVKYPHLRFSFIPYVCKVAGTGQHRMTVDQYRHALDRMMEMENVVNCCKVLFKRLGEKDEKSLALHQKGCALGHVQPLLNLCKMQIQQCVSMYSSNTNTVELTDENLDKLLQFNLFNVYNPDCSVCHDAPRYYEYYTANLMMRKQC